MFGLHNFTAHQIPYLVDIDIKSYEEPWTAEQFRQFAQFVSIALIHGKTIGYYVFQVQGKVANLRRFAIHPNYRRQGHGTNLMHALVNDAKGCMRLITCIDEDNFGGAMFLRSTNLFECRCVDTKYHFIGHL